MSSLITTLATGANDDQITALAAAAIAASAPPWWETFESNKTPYAVGTATGNTLYLYRLDDISAQTGTITWHVGAVTLTTNAKASIWLLDGATFTKAAETASTVAVGTNAKQDVALLSAYERVPGRQYYGGFIADNTSTTFWRLVTSGEPNGKGNKSLSIALGSLTLPATIALGDTAPSASSFWLHGE